MNLNNSSFKTQLNNVPLKVRQLVECFGFAIKKIYAALQYLYIILCWNLKNIMKEYVAFHESILDSVQCNFFFLSLDCFLADSALRINSFSLGLPSTNS